MVWRYMVLICALLAPIPAMAQTYDTPQTLVVMLATPYHTYVDQYGYAVTTGVIQNDSEVSYVGNVVVTAKFYGATATQPLDVVSSGTILEVIPPGMSSPYVIRSSTPDPRIISASPSLAAFDPANPKVAGLDIRADADDLITIHNTANAPQHNITIHVTYHDVFEPPRILESDTQTLDEIGTGQALPVAIQAPRHPAARGAIIHAESEVFSSNALAIRAMHPTDTPPLSANILDAWASDDVGRTLAGQSGQELGLNARVHLPDASQYVLYVQVISKETGEVVLLEDVSVTGDLVSIPWIPAHSGEYIVEMFLWGQSGMPASRPAPILLLTISQ